MRLSQETEQATSLTNCRAIEDLGSQEMRKF